MVDEKIQLYNKSCHGCLNNYGTGTKIIITKFLIRPNMTGSVKILL